MHDQKVKFFKQWAIYLLLCLTQDSPYCWPKKDRAHYNQLNFGYLRPWIPQKVESHPYSLTSARERNQISFTSIAYMLFSADSVYEELLCVTFHKTVRDPRELRARGPGARTFPQSWQPCIGIYCDVAFAWDSGYGVYLILKLSRWLKGVNLQPYFPLRVL